MIKKLNLKKLSDLFQLVGESDISLASPSIARRIIMSNDDPTRISFDCSYEDKFRVSNCSSRCSGVGIE